MLKRVATLGVLAASLCISCAASARNSRETSWDVSQGRLVGPAVMAVVAIREQRVTIYDGRGPILSAPVSTGRKNYDTPVGVFSVLQKEAEHYSKSLRRCLNAVHAADYMVRYCAPCGRPTRFPGIPRLHTAPLWFC